MQFCYELGNTAVKTYGLIKAGYNGDNCISKRDVRRWHADFKLQSDLLVSNDALIKAVIIALKQIGENDVHDVFMK